MASWDELNKKVGGTTTNPKGWNALNEAAKPIAKQMNLRMDVQNAQQASQRDNSAGGILLNTLKGLPNAAGIPQAFNAGVEQTKQGYGQLTAPGQSVTQRGEGLLNLAAGAVNTVSSPLAPIFAPVGKGIEYAGEKLANTPYMQGYGADMAKANQYGVPPEQTNTPERILGAITNASVVGQALLGSGFLKGRTGTGQLPRPGVESPVVPTKLNVKSSTPETSSVSISTPKTRLAEYSKQQGYEPYIPNDQLPTIPMGAKPKEALPVIQADAPVLTKRGSLTYEPVKTQAPTTPQATAVPSVPTVKPIATRVPTPVIGTKASKVAKSVETKAVEQGLSKGFDGVAGYDPITIKDQAARASNLMNRDMKLAKQMVRGEVPMEGGLKGEMLIKAMEDHAIKVGDAQLLRDIAQSPITSETSAHAQAMRILAERNPDSPVTVIRDLQKVRIKKAGGDKRIAQAKRATSAEVRKHIKANAPSKESWGSFIDSITC